MGHFRDDNIWLQLPKPEFSLLLLSYLNFSVILFTFVFVLLFFFRWNKFLGLGKSNATVYQCHYKLHSLNLFDPHSEYQTGPGDDRESPRPTWLKLGICPHLQAALNSVNSDFPTRVGTGIATKANKQKQYKYILASYTTVDIHLVRSH